MSSYHEDKWDATPSQGDEPRTYVAAEDLRRGWVYIGTDGKLYNVPRSEEYGDDWVCHSCALGDKTPWNPSEGCPNYPCHAHRRISCRAHRDCLGWTL